MNLTDTYDYIIAGAGCAGLSLLHRMMNHPFFTHKKILLIEAGNKTANDRTWCFWETGDGPFEDIVYHRWREIDFFSAYFSSRSSIEPYTYKMIRGVDFYHHVLKRLQAQPNIHFMQGRIDATGNEGNKAFVIIENKRIYAQYVFNSILFNPPDGDALKQGGSYFLLQHFKGWVIETPEPFFNTTTATFMDFRVHQRHGTSFAYMLPVSPVKALVEYTLFTPALLQPEEYRQELRDYISRFLRLSAYQITEEETGAIPMTNYRFSPGEGSVVNLGTAGGKTKSSSGYTFKFIQKHSDDIINALITGNNPHIQKSFAQKRFDLYDSTLLQILTRKKAAGDKIFADLFKSNKPQDVLRFLDNETTLAEEIKIMAGVPSSVFIPAAFKELVKNI